MGKLFTYLFAVFITSNILNAYEANILPYILIARESRIGSDSQDTAYKRAFQMMPEYGNGIDLNSAITELLEVECPNLPVGLTLIALSDTPLAGNSDDPVYFLLTPHNELALVIKAFENPDNPESLLLPEISSMDFLLEHKELGIVAPTPIAICKTRIHDKWFGLLVQSPALGTRIDAYLDDSLKNAKDKDRANKLSQLHTIFKRVGEAFARLQYTSELVLRPLPTKTIDALRNKIPLLPEEFRYPGLIDYMDNLISSVQSIEFISSYSHPGAHPANVFYQEDNGQVWFIDLASIHNSFDFQETPLSFSEHDIVRFVDTFRKKAQGYLTDEECDQLKLTLMLAYKDGTREPYADILVEFLTFDRILGRLIKYSQHVQSPDPEIRAEAVSVIDMARRQLLKILSL